MFVPQFCFNMDNKNFKFKIFLLLTICCSSAVGQMSPPPPAAPEPETDGHKYDLEIQKVLLVNETDFVVFQGLKVKRYNKTCEKFQLNGLLISSLIIYFL
jgi:hypothetical protein